LIYGVLVVLRSQERSIDDDQLRTLELITTQYALQIARETQF
jgi:GAF domain-containing protein